MHSALHTKLELQSKKEMTRYESFDAQTSRSWSCLFCVQHNKEKLCTQKVHVTSREKSR